MLTTALIDSSEYASIRVWTSFVYCALEKEKWDIKEEWCSIKHYLGMSHFREDLIGTKAFINP